MKLSSTMVEALASLPVGLDGGCLPAGSPSGATLRALEQRGLAEVYESQDEQYWRLTFAGAAALVNTQTPYLLALQGLAKMLREEFPETSPGAKSIAAIVDTWTAWNVSKEERAAIRELERKGVFDVD